MPRKCVVIGLPTFGLVSMRWAMAFSALQAPMNAITPRIVKWGLEVGEARNAIVADTLRDYPDASHIFFLDDDVVCHPYCLLQLLKAEAPVVGGVYYTKTAIGVPLIFNPPEHGTVPYIPGGGLKQVWGTGGGLTLIKTDVFRTLRDAGDLGADGRGNPCWFRTLGDVPGEQCVNEDSFFFGTANRAGIACWVDQSPYAFGWHLDIHGQQGYPCEQWAEFQEKGTATWEIPDLVARGLIEAKG